MPLKLMKRPGRDAFYLRGIVMGVKVYKSTGITDPVLADAFRIKTENQILRESVYGKKAVKTFDDAVASYLATGAPARFIHDVRKSDGHEGGLLRYFRGCKLADMTQDDLDRVARKLYPTASRETLIRQVYTPFVAIWNHAARRQWADIRMWERPRKPRGTNAGRVVVTRSGSTAVEYEHAATFVAAMSPAPAMLMTVLFFSGMRPIEVFSLQANDVNLPGRWITLVSTKTGEPRGVPMHEFLAPLFESLLKRKTLSSDARIFRTPRGDAYGVVQKGGGGLKSAIDGARRRTGIENISAYTARHSVSTQLVVNGVHLHIKDQILGHAADTMSRRYTQVPQQPLIDAVNTLAVPAPWRALEWWQDPLACSGRLVPGTGKRNDLAR